MFYFIRNCIQIVYISNFVLEQYVFVQERNMLSNSSKYHNKSSAFFLSESMKIWKLDILILFSKSCYISLSRIDKGGPLLIQVLKCFYESEKIQKIRKIF